jgi:hypothetical protein
MAQGERMTRWTIDITFEPTADGVRALARLRAGHPLAGVTGVGAARSLPGTSCGNDPCEEAAVGSLTDLARQLREVTIHDRHLLADQS